MRRWTDLGLCLGATLCLIGLWCPWLSREPILAWNRWRPLDVFWIIGKLDPGLVTGLIERGGKRWWWCLPLTYGFALPGLIGMKPLRTSLATARLQWGIVVGTAAAIGWVVAISDPEPSYEIMHFHIGFLPTCLGVAVIGASSILGQRLQAARRRTWERGRIAFEAEPADRLAMPRTLWSLYDQVARLKCDLDPDRPLCDSHDAVVADVVWQLRALDEDSRGHLERYGASAAAIGDALAPAAPLGGSELHRILRIDAALGRFLAAARAPGLSSPHRR